MKKALNQILKVQSNEGSIINISIVQKQSDLGLTFNQRLLILIEDYSFGYLKGFKYYDQPKAIDVSKCKSLVPVKNIVGDVEKKANVLGVNFFVMENGQKKSKKWVFKFATEILANQWVQLFKNQKSKLQMKKSMRSGSKSPKKSPVDSGPGSKSQLQVPQANNRATFAEVQPGKYMKKQKDFVNNKSDKNIVKKQYKNQMYQTQKSNKDKNKNADQNINVSATNLNKNQNQNQNRDQPKQNFILEEPVKVTKKLQYGDDQQTSKKPSNNNINPNPPNNPSKANPSNASNTPTAPNDPQNANAKQKQSEQLLRLKKQKQQLLKKQQQLRERQRKIEQEQARIQQQKRRIKQEKQKQLTNNNNNNNRVSANNNNNNNNNPQQSPSPSPSPKNSTVINQKFFHKNRQQAPPNKNTSQQQQITKTTAKPKPKLQGINYSQIVNKINISKGSSNINQRPNEQVSYNQNPKNNTNKKLQQTHELLLNRQRQRLSTLNNPQNNPNNSNFNIQQQQQPEQPFQQPHQNPSSNTTLTWTYRHLSAEQTSYDTQYQTIYDFNLYCENIMRNLVQEFHLPQRKRNYMPKFRNQDYYGYKQKVNCGTGGIGANNSQRDREKDDVQFKIAFIGLKDIYRNSQQHSYQSTKFDKICDQKIIKKFQNQFKNYNILYKTIKQLKLKYIRVPLCCICEYQGFIGIFRACSQYEPSNNNNNSNNNNINSGKIQRKIQLQIQKLSNKLKLNPQNFINKQNTLLLKLNNSYYRQVAASQNKKLHANFDYYMIQQIKKLMPYDVLFSSSNNSGNSNDNNNNSNREQFGNNYLREQLLLNYNPRYNHNHESNTQNQKQITQKILSTLKRTSNYKPLKKSSLQPSSSTTTTSHQLSHTLITPITYLIKQLNTLTFYFIHPKQLSDKMHEFGINMRYLGLVYENCSLKFQKCYLMSEMAARVCKTLFRKTIQDINIEQTQQILANNVVSYSQNIRYKVIDFLNCILGSTVQTVTIWKVLSAECQSYYNIELCLEQIQKGYFLQSLIHHCNIDIDWTKITISQAFVTDQFFNQDNFIGINVKTKGYEPYLNQKQKQMLNKMQEQQPNVFKFLQEEFKIQSSGLPLKYKAQRKYLDIFRRYLVNFVPPDHVNYSGINNISSSIKNSHNNNKNGYRLLNLYTNIHGYSSYPQLQIKFMQLKWYLKKQKKQKYINLFNNINYQIVTNFGDFHPLLTQLYTIMCTYHKNNSQFQDAIIFAKSSVINILKICGTTHLRVGQCYYQLAQCCIKANKKDQAIISLQKAKNIFETNQQQYNISYAYVCLKLGLLFLNQSKIKQTQNIIKYAYELFQYHLTNNIKNNIEELYEEERIQCYQILSRCYELEEHAQLQLDLSLECQKYIGEIKNPNNLQRLLKIILAPILGSLKSSDASTYLDIISQIPLQISINTYMKGYNKICQRIEQNSLVQNIQKYLENIHTIVSYVKENRVLSDWKGLVDGQTYERQTVNDFISLTEELIYYLGEGFITGCIRDSL